jgi:hypothetical protein
MEKILLIDWIFSGTIWRFDVEVLEDKIEKLESDGYTTSPIHTHDGLVIALLRE